MIKVIVFGGQGQIGRALKQAAQNNLDLQIQSMGRAEVDITKAAEVDRVLRTCRDVWGTCVVINAAGWTAVDDAEDQVQAALETNWRGAYHLARSAHAYGHLFIQLSTDYVFDGTKGSPYSEDDFVNPLSVYGLSKLAGEHAVRAVCPTHIILRTSWVFSLQGKSFLRKMVDLARTQDRINVVDDQIGSPTSAFDLAAALLKMVDDLIDPAFTAWGTYHYAGSPQASWYDLATVIMGTLSRYGLKSATIIPVTSNSFKTKALRPVQSTLSCQKIQQCFGIQPSDWRAAIDLDLRCLSEQCPDFSVPKTD